MPNKINAHFPLATFSIKFGLSFALAISNLVSGAQQTGSPEKPATLIAPIAPTSPIPYDTSYNIIQPIRAKNGAVVSEHDLASQVGLRILKKGGNAVDAAVAVGFALAVTLPVAGNIGGGGFMIIHEAKTGKNIALDFRELAPATAHRSMYIDSNGNVIKGASTSTHLAVGVPGTVAGLDRALKEYGTMKWKDVIAPAIELADKGFTVTPTLAENLRISRNQLGKWESTKAIFFKNGEPLKEGDTLIQKDLAHSLRLIAKEGARAFYQGEIAHKIAADMKQYGGFITLEDMKNYQAIKRETIGGNYRGYSIITMPPPSSGGVHLIQMLNMLEGYPLKDYGINSSQSIQLMTESMKLAYADRAEHLGDPDHYKVPVQGLISKKYAQDLAQKINLDTTTPSKDIRAGKPQSYESDQTTHYSVVDKFGNAVSTTYTLNLLFGSGIVAKGTGILLNNEMDDFSIKPGTPNAFGLVGGEANAIAANKRPLSSMTPVIVLKNNEPYLITGSPGGSRIITTVLQMLVNTIDFGLNPAEATIAPRFHHQWEPDTLRLEKGFNPDTLNILKQKGHRIFISHNMGRTQTIKITENGVEAYSDPRNPDGSVQAY